MTAVTLPDDAPQSLGEAFAHIGSIKTPTVTDMKVMVLVEAASEELYRQTALGTEHDGVIALLHHNGREEMAHAHRVSKAIKAMNGEDFPPPAAADNPYLKAGAFPFAEVKPEALRKLAQGEFGGEALYEGWASGVGNDEAARLFRLNGREESEHGNRLLEAALLLEA
ncbi:hypothetical protein [Novosphingobium lentum]|uniref:hypothetical protein n=1 Tax=Novosphingobium lentum TaxID=145287 RepID=UPI0008309571|nr:hypothetical protein [Novosphingobium lentum]